MKKRRQRRPTRWRHLRRLARLCLLLILLPLLLLGLIQLQPVQTWLATTLPPRLTRAPYGMTIEGLSGTLPLAPHVRAITISDSQGPWLEIRDITLRIDARRLLQRTIHVQRLTAESLTLHRLPHVAKTTSKPKTDAVPLTQLPFTMDTFTIQTVALPLVESNLTLRVEASVPTAESYQASVQVTSRGTTPGANRLDVLRGPDRCRINAVISQLPLARIPVVNRYLKAGTLDIACSLAGAPNAPTGHVSLVIANLPTLTPGLTNGAVRIGGTLGEGQLTGEATWHGAAHHTDAQVQLPLSMDLTPLIPRVSVSAPTQFALRAAGELQELLAAVDADWLAMTGRVDIAVQGDASSTTNAIQGTATLKNGYLSFRPLALQANHLNVTLRANGDRLELVDTSARAGKGSLEVTGYLGFRKGEGFHHRIALNLKEAGLIRARGASADLSGGLTFNGNLRGASLDGNIGVDRALILIDNFTRKPTTIDVVFDDDPPVEADTAAPTNATWRLAMDLGIDLQDHVSVRGSTLDSTWGGKLTLRMGDEDPVLAGALEVRRGKYRFFGRDFRLSEGAVRFAGPLPPAPFVDVTAIYSRSDMDAQLRVHGLLGSLELELSSIPTMPDDEILSRILFGRDMATISPLQALQLGLAVTSLSGGGLGQDLSSITEELLGGAELQFREVGDSENDTEVGLRKEVIDGVTVEASRSLQSSRNALRLEFELTPRLILETESGSDLRQGIGLRWQYSY